MTRAGRRGRDGMSMRARREVPETACLPACLPPGRTGGSRHRGATGMRGLACLVVMAATAAASPAAQATTSLCSFSVPDAPRDYDIDFVGGSLGLSQLLYWPGVGPSPTSLPIRLVAFDIDRESVHLFYDNPGNPELPPSFEMRGAGRHVGLFHRDSRVLVGHLRCKTWEDTTIRPGTWPGGPKVGTAVKSDGSGPRD